MTAFAWHVHHKILVEVLTVPIENRVEYIKSAKPEWEIEPRLRLLKPVLGELPAAYVKAAATYVKAGTTFRKTGDAFGEAASAYREAVARAAAVGYHKVPTVNVTEPPKAAFSEEQAVFGKAKAAYDKARTAYLEAVPAYREALAACLPEIEALHAIECPDCPWDGKTIFPGEVRS